MDSNTLIEATKAVPATATVGLFLFGIPLETWAVLLSIFFLCLQIGGWVWDRYKKWKANA